MILTFISIRFLDILDIFLVAYIMYFIYMIIRGTTAIKIFLGIFIIYLVWMLVKAMHMQLLGTILGQFIGVGIIALFILFQPELRKFFTIIGTTRFGSRGASLFRVFSSGINSDNNVRTDEIVTACRQMAQSRTGALIVIQKRVRLNPFLQIKEEINSETSSKLIQNIFFKNSPLHDGAMVIIGPKIYAVRCVLPVSEKELPEGMGMRHRSAMGISEISDAIVIVVSEQTGLISYIHNGEIQTGIHPRELDAMLNEEFSAVFSGS